MDIQESSAAKYFTVEDARKLGVIKNTIILQKILCKSVTMNVYGTF